MAQTSLCLTISSSVASLRLLILATAVLLLVNADQPFLQQENDEKIKIFLQGKLGENDFQCTDSHRFNFVKSPGLTPNVKICMNQHHTGSDCPTTLKQQNPATIEEEKDSKTELNNVSHSSYVVHPVIKTLPQSIL